MHFYFQSLPNRMASQLSLFIISTSNVLNSHPNLKANLTASRSSKVIVPIICIVAYIYLWTGLHYGRNMPTFLPCHFFQWTSMKRLPTHVLWSNLTHRSPRPPKQLFQSHSMYNQLTDGVLLSRLITSNILLLIITIIITAPLGINLERRMVGILLKMAVRVALG